MKNSITNTRIFLQNAERIKTMIFDKIMLSVYKKALIKRLDIDDSVFLFDYTDFEGLKKEPYSFVSDTGARLNGGFYYYDNPKVDKLIVFDHGMGAGHRPYMREIETICKAGYLVFSYDHEGTAGSEGKTIRGLTGSLHDLNVAINELKKTQYYEGREIIVIGHSWGGFSTKNIVAFHPEVKKIVPISGFSSLELVVNGMVPNIFKSARKSIIAYEEAMNPGYTSVTAVDTIANSSAKALICQSIDDPIVFSKDHFDPLKEAFSKNPSIRFITVYDRGHNPNFTLKAVKLKDDFFAEKRALEKKNKLKTSEQKSALIAKYDFWQMTEQDMDFWNQVFDFIEG